MCYRLRRVCGIILLLLSVPAAAQAPWQSEFSTGLQLSFPGFSSGNDIIKDLREVKYLLFNADSLMMCYKLDSSMNLAVKALAISASIGDQRGMAHAMNTMGVDLQRKGLHDSAIFYFNKTLPITRSTGIRWNLYRLYLNRAASYFNIGKYGPALEDFTLALSEMEAGKPGYPAVDSVTIYCNVGVAWTRLKAFDQAIGALNQSRQIAERIKDTRFLGDVYARIAEAYNLKGMRDSVRIYYDKGLSMARQYKRTGSVIEMLNSLAHMSLDNKNAGAALPYIQEALQILATDTGAFTYYKLHAFHNLGMYYLELKNYRKAETFLSETLDEVKKTGYRDMIPHMESEVAALYAAKGNYRQAYEHMFHYAMLKDTIFEEDRSESLKSWMDSRLHEKDKELVTKQLFIAQQKNQLQAKNFLVIAIATGTVFLVLLFLAFLRSYRNKQQLQQSAFVQLQKEQEISQLKAQVRGEEQERNRLARELHDGIASHLWAIKLNVESLRQQEGLNESGEDGLAAIYQQLEDTTLEVRKTAHNLMPDLLLEDGLAAALASFCERIRKQTELDVDFMEYGIIPRMDKEIEISIYRMIQELVQNVLKHARGATALLVQISCIDSLLNITVEDNGMGFYESDPESGGMGLRYLKKRIAALQGHIDVQSAQAKGTTVYIEFDIQHLL